MPLIGGDLTAMSGLSERFRTAGADFQRAAGDLTRSASTTLAEFTDEMALLDRDARTLGEEIDTARAGLRTQADATAWTGRHRDQHEEILAGLEAELVALRTSIDDFSTQAKGVVDGALTQLITDMSTAAASAGTSAQTSSDSFASGVESQRAAFDAVMNG